MSIVNHRRSRHEKRTEILGKPAQRTDGTRGGSRRPLSLVNTRPGERTDHRRNGPGRDRRHPAGRHGRSAQSGPDRAGSHRGDGRQRPVPHRCPGARRLHGDLHAARFQHARARRHRVDHRVRGERRRRDGGRPARGDDYGHGSQPDHRRPEHRAVHGDRPRHLRIAADGPPVRQPGASHPGHEHRRRLHDKPVGGYGRHLGRRPQPLVHSRLAAKRRRSPVRRDGHQQPRRSTAPPTSPPSTPASRNSSTTTRATPPRSKRAACD